MLVYQIFVTLAAAATSVMGGIPGTFFWRPRLGLDLSIPSTESTVAVNLPTKENIREGLVVLIDGYEVGMTVVGLCAGISGTTTYPHLNPLSAYFYTNAYRWGLRHFSMIPVWLGGQGGHYCDTHKVWKRRFFYMDEFVPQWMRHMLPFVKKEEWEKEELEFKRFKKYAEPAFGKHFKYPTKKFRDWISQETKETVEDDVISSSSQDV
ncbi:uncharacterized protein LOC121739370 [Aricia agestis]|uniref:uncharacterized protein LOC121739370 n=1 Tax=Aricia agestis TaxID=91739 RepID=UPI001C20B84D|nr:uncharacterized protein LOC121739370 [Aricia agestis]